MGNKKVLLVCFVVFFCFTSSFVWATPPKRYDEGTKTCRTLTMENDLAGYKIFRESCKRCHNRKSETGEFLYTEAMNSKAWNRVFFEKYPFCAKNGHWDGLSQEDQLNLNDYLFRTAFGTYDPNNADDCG